MKHIFAFIFLLCLTTPVFSQNAPVPAYLTAQDFPDSVKSISIQTLNGTRLSFGEMLAKYEGRKLLVDIWASWCRDCIIGYPKLEELRKKAGEKEVVYVFLSVDKDGQKWKAAIDRFNIRGEHYLIDGAWKTPLSNYIALDWIPRYMVIDETGKVLVPKAILADDVALKQALQ